MSLIARPIGVAYRNKGEYNYSIGVIVVDENDTPVNITGSVALIYIDLAGDEQELSGDKLDNIAFYTVLITDFIESGTYKWWIKCFDKDIYGPFDLKIQNIA